VGCRLNGRTNQSEPVRNDKDTGSGVDRCRHPVLFLVPCLRSGRQGFGGHLAVIGGARRRSGNLQASVTENREKSTDGGTAIKPTNWGNGRGTAAQLRLELQKAIEGKTRGCAWHVELYQWLSQESAARDVMCWLRDAFLLDIDDE
jgi:hypothetical protein